MKDIFKNQRLYKPCESVFGETDKQKLKQFICGFVERYSYLDLLLTFIVATKPQRRLNLNYQKATRLIFTHGPLITSSETWDLCRKLLGAIVFLFRS